MTPAIAAQRLLFGTGLGMILATGLGLISRLIEFNSLGPELMIPIFGFTFLVLGYFTGKGEGPLKDWFPLESRDKMVLRLENEISTLEKDSHLGDAWAKLEETMLSKELEEE